MRKKTVSILTSAVAVVTFSLSMLFGCSNQHEVNNGTTTTTPPTTTTVHTHSYTESIAEAACETDGIKTFTCACGNTYTETIAKLGHDYSSVITAPTCTEAGFTIHTCSRCNHSYTDTETAALGHAYDEGTTITEATCETDGSMTLTCTVCSTTQPEVIAKLGHSYTPVVTAPTCTEAGFTTHTCANCDGSYTDSETSATGHSYESVASSAKKATCTKDGKEADTKCSNCGNVVEGAIISATGHSYGEYVYNNDATTEKDGTETAICSACGKTKTRTTAGTKLEPETLWSDGYAKHIWHDMGGYMFWIGDTQEEANNMAWSNEIQSQADILSKRYPDRSVYNMSSHPDGVPIAFTSTKIDVPSWRPTFIWAGGSAADANANEPTQLESFDPLHAEGLPFVPFQIYDEGDMVYYWYPVGSFYGYGKFTEQDNAAKYECHRIIHERYNINSTESKPFYETYYYKCSLGYHNIDGEKYILYRKSITYVPGTH